MPISKICTHRLINRILNSRLHNSDRLAADIDRVIWRTMHFKSGSNVAVKRQAASGRQQKVAGREK